MTLTQQQQEEKVFRGKLGGHFITTVWAVCVCVWKRVDAIILHTTYTHTQSWAADATRVAAALQLRAPSVQFFKGCFYIKQSLISPEYLYTFF